MLFVRMFLFVAVGGALMALGYALWLTFEPLDAPPQDPDGEWPMITTTGVQVPGQPPLRAMVDGAAAARTVADDLGQKASDAEGLVLDRLREPLDGARAAATEVKKVVRDVRQAKDDVEATISSIDVASVESAWRTAKDAGSELMNLTDAEALPLLEARGRIHPSGAPAPGGGGAPGTARQPGIDWYRAGGKD